MEKQVHAVITGTGSYIPTRTIPNSDFLDNTFFDKNGEPYDRSNEEIIQKFEEITGIKERRYVTDDIVASDMAAVAGQKAIEHSGINPETLDYIIVAQNFGDIRADNLKVDMVPTLASRAKAKLDINNPRCIAYDLPFGCPGWLQGMIQANCFIKSGEASKALIIGSETLSRVCDPHDRDSMIYADGAGAAILEKHESDKPTGILASAARTDTNPQAYFLNMKTSCKPEADDELYLKMEGHKLYQYALKNVPGNVQESINKAGLHLDDINKVLIHQANEKMDNAILERIAKLYDRNVCSEKIMPMIISGLGNSSVATVPTLLDLVRRGSVDNHTINKGDNLVFASVGAGMNINSMVYKVPE